MHQKFIIMKRPFLFTFFLVCIMGISQAQVSEVGLCGGVSFYMGDINPTGVFKGSKPAGGVIYRYNINPLLAFKSTVLFGSIGANDAEYGKTDEAKARNLSFVSPISEISAQLELNFMRLYNEAGRNAFAPYLFAGIGIFSFNPQAKASDGNWYDLQMLGTEGQGLNQPGYEKEPYSLIGLSIPFGLGMRYNFLKYYSIGVEWGMRMTFTDYIDDVSTTYVSDTVLRVYRHPVVAELADPVDEFEKHKPGTARGNAQTKDWFSYAVVTFTFKLNYQKACPSMGKPIPVNKKRRKYR